MGMLDSESDFRTELTKGMIQTQMNLFTQAWEGWGDSGKGGGSSSDDGMGAFLAPLEKPLSMLKNATDDVINSALEDAIRTSIY